MNISDDAVALTFEGGIWSHAKPLRDTSWLHRWKRERNCTHEWHPEAVMGVDWFCCKCGKETDAPHADQRHRTPHDPHPGRPVVRG